MSLKFFILKTLLFLYKKVQKILGGKGLTKYSLVRALKDFSLTYFRTDFAKVQGHKMFLGTGGIGLVISHYGSYEAQEAEIMKEKIRNGDVVIDIGANIGLHTLLMAKLVGKEGKVFAFEPDPSNFKILEKNVKINGYQNVILEQKAVADQTGKLNLYLSKKNSGMHRIHPLPSNSNGCIQVPVIKLDDYFKNNYLIDKIRFVKIDVEGAELRTLNGMNNILRINQIKFLIEFMPELIKECGSAPEELLDLLKNYHFTIYCIDENEKKLNPVESSKEILETISRQTIGRNLFCEKL